MCGDFRDDLDHYLEILPSSSTARATARAEGTFTPVHEAFWATTRAAHGEVAGTRELIEVLLLHRRMPAQAVHIGIEAALRAGSVSADVVANEVRKAEGEFPSPKAAPDDEPAPWEESGGTGIPLPRLLQLPATR